MNRRCRIALSDDRWVIEVTDDGSRTLVEIVSDDGHHSSSGALTETRHVYLQNSGVATRLAAGLPTSVLEVGLGTGMAALVTIEEAIRGNADLTYVALERNWPPAAVLRELRPAEWVTDAALAERFLEWRSSLPEPIPVGDYRWQVDARRALVVVIGDAIRWEPSTDSRFHAVYLDPFAPASNPELWSQPFLGRVRGSLTQGGRLVTYCVSRAVREAMEGTGWATQRVRGPTGGKREVLVATPSSESPSPGCSAGDSSYRLSRVQRGNESQPTGE